MKFIGKLVFMILILVGIVHNPAFSAEEDLHTSTHNISKQEAPILKNNQSTKIKKHKWSRIIHQLSATLTA